MGNCLPFGGHSQEDLTPLEESEDHTSRSPGHLPQQQDSVETSNVNQNPPPYDHSFFAAPVGADGRVLSEDQQVQLARRLGLIQHLPEDTYVEGGKAGTECIICMVDFMEGDRIRFLPCLHTYHLECIDDWLVRQFSCPSCMEPVDSALLCSYQTAELAELSEFGTSPAMNETRNFSVDEKMEKTAEGGGDFRKNECSEDGNFGEEAQGYSNMATGLKEGEGDE